MPRLHHCAFLAASMHGVAIHFAQLDAFSTRTLAAGSNLPALSQEGLPRHQPQPIYPESRNPHLPVKPYTDRLLLPRQLGNRLAREETLSQTLVQLSLASCKNLKAMCLPLLMGRQ